jgi:hypothetical protein
VSRASFAGFAGGGFPAGLGIPIAVAGLAGLLRALAPLLPIVEPDQAPGFTSQPLLIVLALLPVLLAAAGAARGRGALAAGLLAAVAAFVPGQVVLDLQLVEDATRALQPDLVLPTSLAPTTPAAGLWLLLAGHLLTLLAGGLAAYWYMTQADTGSTGDARGPGLGAPPAQRPGSPSGQNAAAVPGPGRVALLLSVGVVAAIAVLLSKPFESGNAYLLSRSILEQSGLLFAGGLLLVVAVPVACAFAAAAADPEARRGGLLGVALGLLTLALPQLVAGLAVEGLVPTWGPVLALAVAVVLIGLAVRAGGTATDANASGLREDALDLPGPRRSHIAAGALGVLAGLAAIVSGLSAQIVLPPGLPQLASYADWLLIPAGIGAGLLGAALLAAALFGDALFGAALAGAATSTRWQAGRAAALRPAYLVVLVLVPLAAAQALDGVLAATEIDGVRIGAGPWLGLFAVLAALGAAGCAVLAGSVEREDVDLTERRSSPVLLAVASLGALLAVAALVFPTFTAPGYSAPSLSAELSIGWWGLALSALAVAGAALLAAFSRPARAVALLLGGALVIGIHLLELPLTSARVRDFSPTAGTWLGLAALLALLVAAGIAVAPKVRARTPGDR